MRARDLINGYDYGKHMRQQMYCFGSDSGSDSDGLSDEDMDQDLQQDIAAAAAENQGVDIGGYDFDDNFDRSNADIATAVQATQDVMDSVSAARAADPMNVNAGVRAAQDIIGASPTVQAAINNLAGYTSVGTPSSFANRSLVSDIIDRNQRLGTPTYDITENYVGAVTDPTFGTPDQVTETQEVYGMDDEYDPEAVSPEDVEAYADQMGYDLSDASTGYRDARTYGGITAEQLADIQARAESPFGFAAKGILDKIEKGTVTGYAVDDQGRVQGVKSIDDSAFGKGLSQLTTLSPISNLLGLDPNAIVETYTGRSEFNPSGQGSRGFDNMDRDGGEPEVPPVQNPMTGTVSCPDGYTFDPDKNACVESDVTSDQAGGGQPVTNFPLDPDMYVRMTALDQSPRGLPSGFDFDAANRRFQESYAYRPQYYGRTPMNLTGFTRLR